MRCPSCGYDGFAVVRGVRGVARIVCLRCGFVVYEDCGVGGCG
ncbi:MAG: hypothetical protein QXZ56_07970 [Sulfolobales archaeon]